LSSRMNAIHHRKHKANPRVNFEDAGPSTAIPVPNRYSSAICTYWTDLDKVLPSGISPENGAPSATAAEDLYLRTLKQLSATHRPSLDNLPLDRSTTINASEPTSSDNPPAGYQAGNPPGEQPRVIGRRYHRRPDGGIDVEFVDVSAHYQQQLLRGHSSVNKVRPAAGVLPFNNSTVAPRADNGTGHPAAAVVAPAPATVVCPKHEDREARRRRWFGWHSARTRGQEHGGGGGGDGQGDGRGGAARRP
ncbi:hypothetical protein C8A01DRAFT_19807, partial [Parachaetomium inaequale]